MSNILIGRWIATRAAIICRERRQLFVGIRGGLTLCNPAKFVKDEEGQTRKVYAKGWVTGRRALSHPSM